MRTCVNLVNKICNSIQLFARPKILFCWERGRERERAGTCHELYD